MRDLVNSDTYLRYNSIYLGIQPFENRSKRRKLGNSLDEVKAELIKRFNVEGEIKEQWRNTFDQIVEEFKQYFPLVDVFLVGFSIFQQ